MHDLFRFVGEAIHDRGRVREDHGLRTGLSTADAIQTDRQRHIYTAAPAATAKPTGVKIILDRNGVIGVEFH